MMRSLAASAAALAIGAAAHGQVFPRPATHIPPQPAGVIRPVSLPITGSLTPPSPTSPITPFPRRSTNLFPGLTPWAGGFSYGGLYPYYYDDPYYYQPAVAAPVPPPQPVTNVTNLIVTTPEQPPELRARLNLNVPPNAKVLLAGKDVDTAAQPLVLESPVLKEGQKYTFDVKVSWREGDKTEERARVVAVDAGESKTLTYLTVK
ncbi:MAG TPA: hypothetical protein VKE40_19085 [Gemmataceae bacterium]|nr:hypothetical protein [Gemmataceae bacterium]